MPWRQLAIGIVNGSDHLTAPPARARPVGRQLAFIAAGRHDVEGVGQCPPEPIAEPAAAAQPTCSDRQLPPGHDPGADSGEAPNGRQRGSRPLDILVECRGHLRPRLDEPPSRDGHHDHVRFAPDEPGSPRRAQVGRVETQTIRAVTAITALPAGTRRRWSRPGQSRAHRASVKNGKSHGDHGRNGGNDRGHDANGGPVPTVRA